MLTPAYSKQFERDLKRIRKRGKDLDKLKAVLHSLLRGLSLDALQREHKLIGNFAGRHECHIESDWLLIYKKEPARIVFERTGTHADLYRK